MQKRLADWASWAVFTQDRKHRYSLTRTWDVNRPIIAYIGLNPSTADENKLDNTTTKCVQWAKRDLFGTYVMLNLFAFVSTDPKGLLVADDPVGELNNEYIRKTCSLVDTVVFAWGAHRNQHPLVRSQTELVMRIARENCDRIMCLGLTQHGFPKHPLYLPKTTQLIPFYNPR